MDTRKLITRIALGVAAVATVFSIITLIRALVIGRGVLFAAVQVIGTLIITAVCAIMLYVIRKDDEEDMEPETTDAFYGGNRANIPDSDPGNAAETAENKESEQLSLYEEPSRTAFEEKYHFENFE